MNEFFGQQSASTPASAYSAFSFMVQQMLNKLCTMILVQVVSVTSAGAVAMAGTVSVQPLVNQLTGNNQAQPHGIINNISYQRIQGGLNALIMDPQVGDIGLCVFAMRDISTVVSSGAQGNPGSARKYDWADGVYIGGVLNGVPTQYVQFNASGMALVSPKQITLTAPTVTIQASNQFNVQSPDSEFTGTIHTPETITGDTDVVAAGVSGATHTHGGVESGSDNTGPPS